MDAKREHEIRTANVNLMGMCKGLEWLNEANTDLLLEVDILRQLLRANTFFLRPEHLSMCDTIIIGEEAACNCGLQRALRDE
jgi:hypothetical protein